MKVKIIRIADLNMFEQEVNNWFLLNQNKEIKYITQSYVSPVINPIRDDDPIRKDPTFKNASYTKIRGFTVLSIFYEEKE